ncbi:MAG TPA: M3 family metallopeptidase [Anaeromyxobacteraceae bacterium]|nr:M3 family metallopeptidase [Anaeromyxobacteraceae bacterium]
MPEVPGLSRAATLMVSSPGELAAASREDVRRARAAAAELAARGGRRRDEADLELYDAAFGLLADAGARASLCRSVHPSEEMRAAAEACEQEVEAAHAELSLDPALYRALGEVDVAGADPATRWLVERGLRDFRRSGVDRDPATRERVRALREELVRLGQAFGRAIKDDVKTVRLEPSELEGLPEDWRRARPPGEDGRVAVTTDPTDYQPALTYSRSASVRERLWRAYRTRAHPANTEVLAGILGRRAELARLLGYPSWAAYATEDKMIGSDVAAADFVERVSKAAEARMRLDCEELLAFKRRDLPGATRVDPWDAAYYSERVKAERYGAEAQAVRPYLEYAAVRDGLLALTGRLFGIEYRRVAGAPAWHPDVEAFDVLGAGERLGRIWLDMHPRPGKYKHFAQFTLVNGQRDRKVPEGVLVCNFPRPGAEPALLEHGDVKTFLHELGHLLHHVLGGRTRWGTQAGVATEWDFVEAPSQLLEEWVWNEEALGGFARHHRTGEPVPGELLRRLRAADEFGKGLQVRQQMFYAAVSLELHRRDPAGLDAGRLADELYERYTPFRAVEGTHFLESFGHLDGYSALYYTYMWSLAIAKDLFGVFEREGLFSPAAIRYRREVLEPGGSARADELVRAFLGRAHGFEAFARWLNAA